MDNTNNTRTVIETVDLGARTIAGTDWPVVDQVVRDQRPGRRPEWQVVRSLCNGVPASVEIYRTRAGALAAL